MDTLKKWFLANGDHFLNQVSILLIGGEGTGMLPPSWKYTPVVTVILSMLHTIFIPQQPVPVKP